MSSPSSFNSALHLNNEGVSLMMANQNQQAAKCLARSLNLVKQIIAPLESRDEAPSASSSCTPIILHDDIHALIDLEEDPNCSFVYHNALTFALRNYQNEKYSLQDEQANLHVYSATIVLNIALLYNRQGKLGNPACLTKAKQLYETVTKLVGSSPCDNQGAALLVQLAAINNHAQILRDQGEIEAAQDGFHLLVWIIQTSDQTDLVNTEIIQGMLLNALVSSTPCLLAAAA
jgi:tetratricopeptide (TPR) repeat protein